MSSTPHRSITTQRAFACAVCFLGVHLVLSVTGFEALVRIAPLVAAGLVILLAADHPRDGLYLRATASVRVTAFSFALSVLASTALSIDPISSLHAIGAMGAAVLVLYLLAQLPQCYIHWIFCIMAAVLLVASCSVMFMFLASAQSRPGAVFAEYRTPALAVPNDIVFGAILLPIVASYANRARGALRALAVAGVLCFAYAAWLSQSRLCVLLIALVVVLHVGRTSHLSQALASLLLIVFGAVAADQWFELGFTENFGKLQRENARLSIWSAGLTQWAVFPLLGIGPGHFEVIYDRGIRAIDLPSWLLVEHRRIPWAHNIYLESYLERGVVGLLTQLALFTAIYLRLRQSVNQAEPAVRPYFSALLISFVVFLCAGMFELTLNRIWVVNMLAVYIGVCLMPRSSPY